MKRKFYSIMMLLALIVCVCNMAICFSTEKNLVDFFLNDVEAVAGGESGSDHGRPLMQSQYGNFKCANCSGNDCGAAC